jgi:ribonuclease VapC
MIVDTSALVAILQEEPGWEAFRELIIENRPARLSAGNYIELGIVLLRARNPAVSHAADDFVPRARIVIEPVTERQARIAREAYRDYGKASGHPARLNFGDCFAYALARDRGEPLLFKGDDFRHTDIRPAIR